MNILTFRDHQISQRTDGFVNLSQMAKANSKRLNAYIQSSETQKYLKAAQESICHESCQLTELLQTLGFGKNKATWGHPLVALHLAQWISPEFHVWCNRHIKTLIETGETKVSRKKRVKVLNKTTEVLDNHEQRISRLEANVRRVRSGLELRLDIEAVLCDPALQHLPNTKIAVICGCSESMIRKYKDERVGIFRTKKSTKKSPKKSTKKSVQVQLTINLA